MLSAKHMKPCKPLGSGWENGVTTERSHQMTQK
jgi:hypothetical protein